MPRSKAAWETVKCQKSSRRNWKDIAIVDTMPTLKKLVEKYRAIFDWDVPDIDQAAADKLILTEVRRAVDALERKLLG